MRSQMASSNPVDLDTFVEDEKKVLIQNEIESKNILEIKTEIDTIQVEIKTENYNDDDTEFIDSLKSDFAEYYVTKIEENELHIKEEDDVLLDEVNKNYRHHKHSKKQCSCCETVKVKDQINSCTVCKKKFSTVAGLKMHLLVHTRENKFKCSICDKEFTQNSSLKRHLTIHDTVHNKSKCNLCNIYVVNLNRHQLVHTGQQKYNCEYCDKSFGVYQNFKQHLLRHGDKLFTCFQCNQNFYDKTKLKRHIITHGDDRRFKCDICKKSFFFNKNLRQHLLTHTGEKNFKCNICDKSFSQHGHLKTHLVTHTDERKFKCDLCNVNFRFNTNLQRHIKRHGISRKKKSVVKCKVIEIVK